jgi:hypothetical protein
MKHAINKPNNKGQSTRERENERTRERGDCHILGMVADMNDGSHFIFTRISYSQVSADSAQTMLINAGVLSPNKTSKIEP